jgi:hypothetical protein
MTTPKAEAMAREIYDVVLASVPYPSGRKTTEADIAKTLAPLLSAEKERDELKAKMEELKVAHDLALSEISRAFLAKQGERI